MQILVNSPEQMESLGRRLAEASVAGMQIHLSGDLGAGKTTLVRGFLHGFGYTGKVKSPTYTLVEPYSFVNLSIFHFDFYRVNSPAEIESIGFREYPGADAICLIEWPEKGGNMLEKPDLVVRFKILGLSRELEMLAYTPKANSLISIISGENNTN
jgi:tRNA threonylcarbamoyladenosine biosynthesis protein TsaE